MQSPNYPTTALRAVPLPETSSGRNEHDGRTCAPAMKMMGPAFAGAPRGAQRKSRRGKAAPASICFSYNCAA